MSVHHFSVLHLRLCVVCASLIVALGCDVHDVIPNPVDTTRPTHPVNADLFGVGATELRGIYGNVDVVCGLMTFVTSAPDAAAYWEQVEENLEGTPWRPHPTESSRYREFSRFIEYSDQSSSLLVVRVGIMESTRKVAVAWLYDDGVRAADDRTLHGAEETFAKQRLWPKFESALN